MYNERSCLSLNFVVLLAVMDSVVLQTCHIVTVQLYTKKFGVGKFLANLTNDAQFAKFFLAKYDEPASRFANIRFITSTDN